ncbi:dephospho-CoA kinase [Terasakiella sp. A23]|uniref:dephospho-CoA kinase n=1 Tax=Terasakiella sp. FCG-A23 TaxID=3080561 RepID=UPI002954EEBF|nr:dephospho-CoA kinase [Terasakiella sp. A23]MDV7339892.1 dephospho-CoA kinase [Terasakiella sp. A23]
MFILGLTGSIGMGKSATAQLFRDFGVPVHDADATVHKLMAPNGAATALINDAFGDCLDETGAVDRVKLGSYVFKDADALKKLEAILHPMVRAEEQKFLRLCQLHKEPIVVLDIPLLYETKGQDRCDAVAVVSASKTLQEKRVLKRPQMTREKFQAILKKQMADAEKRKRADYVIFSGAGFRSARNQVKKILKQIRS